MCDRRLRRTARRKNHRRVIREGERGAEQDTGRPRESALRNAARAGHKKLIPTLSALETTYSAHPDLRKVESPVAQRS